MSDSSCMSSRSGYNQTLSFHSVPSYPLLNRAQMTNTDSLFATVPTVKRFLVEILSRFRFFAFCPSPAIFCAMLRQNPPTGLISRRVWAKNSDGHKTLFFTGLPQSPSDWLAPNLSQVYLKELISRVTAFCHQFKGFDAIRVKVHPSQLTVRTVLPAVIMGHFNFWLNLSLSDSLSKTLSWTLKSGLRPKFNLTRWAKVKK